MSKEITIQWLGHSCFKLTCEGYSVVLDPYTDDSVPGYSHVRTQADEVLASHEHADHNFREAVTIVNSGRPNPFRLTKVACPHDDDGGRKRGMNMIHVFDNGELRVAHFGDVGCPLNEAQIATIGKLDAAMVPVGGHFTMEPDGIWQMVQKLNPRVVIPMHYRSETFGYPVIGTLDAYLKYVTGDIVRYDTDTLTLTKETPAQTAVLRYIG